MKSSQRFCDNATQLRRPDSFQICVNGRKACFVLGPPPSKFRARGGAAQWYLTALIAWCSSIACWTLASRFGNVGVATALRSGARSTPCNWPVSSVFRGELRYRPAAMLLPPAEAFFAVQERPRPPVGSSGARIIFNEEKSRPRFNVALRAGLFALAFLK